ncbi:MAG: S49 family peptidase [Parvularculaceae bacterium]
MSERLSPAAAVRKRLPFLNPKPVVTALELSGVVDASTRGRGLSLSRVEDALDAAFRPSKLAAVALLINSPGGSPVQSNLLLREIRRRAAKKKAPVIAFIQDVGASGGYMLALAADEIYADASSIVGSIGVISAGFGFHEAIDRLGVERRVRTAGESKSQLDPFRPQNEEDLKRLDAILTDIHATFIETVRERRGDKLNAAYDDVFTGAFWTAAPAEARGLIDGIAHLDEFMRQRFGDRVKIKRVTVRPSILRQAFGGRVAFDAGDAVATLAERSLWARYGL